MNDPTPEEIRARRVKLHRDRGELQDAERVANGKDYEFLIPDDEEAPPELRTICQIGLTNRITTPLERYGVMFVGDLCGWSEQRLRLIPEFGDGSIADIRKALAPIGLALREQRSGEFTPPLPAPLLQVVRDALPSQKLTQQQIDRMFAMIARDVSQREIARRMGLVRWTVWNRLRLFKVLVRSMVEAGANDEELRKRLSDDRWSVWQKSLVWDQTKKTPVRLAA